MTIHSTISWINDALATKNLGQGMTYYRVQGGDIRATNGKITASHPWEFGGEFLVPGKEFEKVLSRMKDNVTIETDKQTVTLKSGRLRGAIQTLPLTEWDYPAPDEAKWKKMPKRLIEVLTALRPFILDDASQEWAKCVALQDGWAYATNNIAVAGAECPGPKAAMLPYWAVDFILGRVDALAEWAWEEHYVAFRWGNGAWMRSQLVVGEFQARAGEMVRKASTEKATQQIDAVFKTAFNQCAELSEDTVSIYADRITSGFGKAMVEDAATCEVPDGSDHSIWGAKFLLPVIAAATSWSPASWPKPALFRGPVVSGYVVGRKQ